MFDDHPFACLGFFDALSIDVVWELKSFGLLTSNADCVFINSDIFYGMYDHLRHVKR